MLLLPYQQRWIQDNHAVKVYVKSRRVGISWTEALNSVLHASLSGGRSTIYLSYNRDMTRNFINDCAFWARSLNIASSDTREVMIEDEDKDILAFEIRFKSGKTIKALSGKPNNIRGKQARVVIDEAAFCENLPELMKAAIALLMWGGQVSVISTQNGEDNEFNLLVQKVLLKELKYSLHRTTLDDALADGLYKRICLVQGKQWTSTAQEEWRTELYRDYGIAAAEELDCQPFSAQAGKVFNRGWFEIVDSVPFGGTEFRAWDMASTAADVNKDAFYTAGAKGKKVGDIIYILDAVAEQVSPADGDELIKKTALSDGSKCKIRWEREGGSAGLRDEAHLKKLLLGYDAQGVKPQGDKLTRAKPYASEALNGRVKLLRGPWNEMYVKSLHQFDGTRKILVNDLTDASSLLYSQMATSLIYVPDSLGVVKRR